MEMKASPTKLAFALHVFSFTGLQMITGTLLNDVLHVNGKELFSDKICDVDERENLGCSVRVGPLRSNLECFVLCSREDLCIGASLDALNTCFHHRQCPDVSGCTTQRTDHRYKRKEKVERIDNRDSGPSTTTSEPPENEVIEKCRDLKDMGYPPGDYVRTMNVGSGDDRRPVKVVCRVRSDSEPYTSLDDDMLYVARNEGTKNFNLSLSSYKTGFFYDSKNLWLGFDNWKYIGGGVPDIIVELHFSEGFYYEYMKHEYFSFSSSSLSSSDFSYEVDHGIGSTRKGNESLLALYNQTFGDCFKSAESTQFSAYDMDNDQSDQENCAALSGSAWWYPGGCHSRKCNLLGWSWKYNQTKPLEQLMKIDGIDMAVIGKYLQRIDIIMDII